jgi:lipid-A-disaccharide synthase
VGSIARVLIVAGESSGDQYGGKVAAAMRSFLPEVELFGIGGREMERAGVTLLFPSSEIAVVGITEALGKIWAIRRAWQKLKSEIRSDPPCVAILIDFPGFNLRLSKLLKSADIPVLYYVSPQIWAWNPRRIRTIVRTVTKMAVILPFEERIYQEAGVDVEFVGHPLMDLLNTDCTRDEARSMLGLPQDCLAIGVLPGSREREIKSLLPPLLGAGETLRQQFASCRFVLPVASTIARTIVEAYTKRVSFPVDIVDGKSYEVLRAVDLALVASGTVTLEGAIAHAPMVIVYKVSVISYLLGRLLVKVKCIGLANIVTGKRVVPEYIQGDVNPQTIATAAAQILSDPARIQEIQQEFRNVTAKLGGPGASTRVAQIAVDMMGSA